MTTFVVEIIPDEDAIFRRVHENYVKQGKLQPGFFVDYGGGMSANWNKYCTAEGALAKAKEPEKNGVISLNVAHVRAIDLTVDHTPSHSDQSHSEVFGPKTSLVRMKLRDAAQWAIKTGNAL